jgi:glycosyltransferase involved in cell wall biosynthesis
MSQPEWEDAGFEGKVDQNFPDWTRVDLKGFRRPGWFFQETLIPAIPERYRAISSIFSKTTKAINVKRLLGIIAPALHRFYWKSGLSIKLPLPLKNFLRPFFYRCYYKPQNCNNTQPKIEDLSFFFNHQKELERLTKDRNILEEFTKLFPWREDKLTEKDFLPYLDSLHWFRKIFSKYDLIHACATDPIYAMLAMPDRPYIAFEHGTLRDLPFENSPQGRLLSLAYRKARKVIITNPDTISSAEKLGIKDYVFIPHPLDEAKYAPRETPVSKELRKRYNIDHILFCPTRHDWAVKGTNIAIEGFGKYIKAHNKKALLILTLWGQDIKRSKRLIGDLGIKEYILWVPVLNETRHVEYLNAADIVLDQMILPSFGAIACKAMSCAKPVITSFRSEANQWCFEESPPLVSAFDKDDVCRNITQLLHDSEHRDEIGKKAREWILKYHSSGLVADKLIKVYKEVLQHEYLADVTKDSTLLMGEKR